MREDRVVSLWVGQANSPDALDQYLQTGYTEDGDFIPSQFARDFGIRFYDEDFREAQYFEAPSQSVQSVLKGFSYDDVIVPRFTHLCGELFSEPVNAVLLLYNFEYKGEVDANAGGAVSMRYVGSVTMD